MAKTGDVVRLEGCAQFRQRVVFSILSARVLRIDKIRSEDERPGLRDYEANFLRLIDKLTNGTSIVINDTGTKFRMVPGLIHGGEIEHDCNAARPIGYSLEGILPLLPFAKEPCSITFTGITDAQRDFGFETLKGVTMRLLKPFGIESPALDLQLKKRGMAPEGGGKVVLHCPVVRTLRPVQLIEPGHVKRIRGVAFAARTSPQMANRMVTAARGVFNALLADVYLRTDHARGFECGRSPGYGISVIAETTTGALFSAECVASKGQRPEDVGTIAAHRLLQQISQGGVIDTSHQGLLFAFLALGPEDVSRLRIGKLSTFGIGTLRLIETFFGVRMLLKPDRKDKSVLCSCLGANYTNVSKKVT